ncbi:DUF4238 domain-containing protein [Paenarthrobacter sp. YJN-5]|uniref:DUF4238 domain-containing protein n=1 Tax=Paenarthrobacter sp. YJN-5 TaxID=2735316 RepID=UPI00187828A6|nr:DUF4238 domain-containing protein [Paenarthrobacter sp. YJN-5]QOT19444.1 DUF4238 domain-containing protein [Paenarthrobacter sp. YJN-5]
MSGEPPVTATPNKESAEETFLRDLIQRSRKNDGARKHHVVPNSYLRRWSKPSGRVQVCDVATGKSYATSPATAARVTDFYLLESPDLDPDEIPPAFVENLLALIEGRAVPALDSLLDLGPDGISGQERADIATFLGFQSARGQQTRNMIQQVAADMSKYLHPAGTATESGIRSLLETTNLPLTDELLAEVLDFQRGLQDGSIIMQPQQAALVGMPISMAIEISERLFTRHWTLFRTRPVLSTCDEPVIPIGGPGHPRDRRAGFGTAPVVIFPVAPDALLVMFLGKPAPLQLADLGHVELAEINREIAAAASRWVIDREGRKTALAFDIPPWPDAITSLEEGQVDDTGRAKLLHGTWMSRWAASDIPPEWPVLRWFR